MQLFFFFQKKKIPAIPVLDVIKKKIHYPIHVLLKHLLKACIKAWNGILPGLEGKVILTFIHQLVKGKHSKTHFTCKGTGTVNTISRHCSQTTDVNTEDFLFLSALFFCSWVTGRSLSGIVHRTGLVANQDQAQLGSSGTLHVSVVFKDSNSPFYWHEMLLKSNYSWGPKLCWCTLNAYCSYESFFSMIFPLLSEVDAFLMHLYKCCSLPFGSLYLVW